MKWLKMARRKREGNISKQSLQSCRNVNTTRVRSSTHQVVSFPSLGYQIALPIEASLD